MFFFFKQKTAYEMRISDWSSDVCSSDLIARVIEMGMGENDCIDAGGRDRPRFPIEFTQIFHALKQAAIDQDALAVMLEQMFGNGDGSGGAKSGRGEHPADFNLSDGGVMVWWGCLLPTCGATFAAV